MNAKASSVQLNAESYFDNKKIKKYRQVMLSPFKFRLAMAYMLPLGAITGIRITDINEERCEVTVPYKFLNKNPFKTTYWAVLGMAAELAGGVMLLTYTKHSNPTCANFVVSCESQFVNRALGITRFECNDGLLIKEKVIEAIETGEAVTFYTETIGYSPEGKVVTSFKFGWSVKPRKE